MQFNGPCIPKGWGITLVAKVMGLNTIEATGRLKLGIVSTIITSARLILIH